MKNEMKMTKGIEAEISIRRIISLIIPSLNRDSSVLIFLSIEKHKQLMVSSKNNNKRESFAFFCDSDACGNLIDSGHGSLSREQFDGILKEEYNNHLQNRKGGEQLKNVA